MTEFNWKLWEQSTKTITVNVEFPHPFKRWCPEKNCCRSYTRKYKTYSRCNITTKVYNSPQLCKYAIQYNYNTKKNSINWHKTYTKTTALADSSHNKSVILYTIIKLHMAFLAWPKKPTSKIPPSHDSPTDPCLSGDSQALLSMWCMVSGIVRENVRNTAKNVKSHNFLDFENVKKTFKNVEVITICL